MAAGQGHHMKGLGHSRMESQIFALVSGTGQDAIVVWPLVGLKCQRLNFKHFPSRLAERCAEGPVTVSDLAERRLQRTPVADMDSRAKL